MLFNPRSRTNQGRSHGGWTLSDSGLAPIENWEAGPAVVFVPSEHVLLALVDLPASHPRDRLSALAFSLEDDLCQPLEEMTFALGNRDGDQRQVAAAVSRGKLEAWIAMIDAAGLGHAMIAPDVMALPKPPPATWRVRMDGERALVRTDDGAGFAIHAALLETAWAAAARPAMEYQGQQRPPAPLPAFAALTDEARGFPAINLRQGEYAPRKSASLIPGLVAVGLVALAAHGAVLAIEGALLQRLAAQRREEALSVLRQVSPDIGPNADLAVELDALAQPATARFGPLLAKSSAALTAVGDHVRLRALSFDAREQALTLTVEADDLGALQRVNSALTKSGLGTTTGAASLQDGAALGDLVVREPAP